MSEVSRVSLLPEGTAQVLDRYQLIGEIASGGMASVFLARLPGVGGFSRLVAIKRLHPHLAGEPEFVEMFLDEARLAASIHHRNVVPILEIGSSALGYYLVMEYIEGVTLAKLMTHATATRRPVPRSALLRITIDTLSGLHAAHELTDESGDLLGVVHRDCSPQNILVGLDGCTRITDFGIARASSRLHTTREGAMKGKLAYMAPEQTHGEGFDRRADLFSVGVVLWEILAQARLFKGTTEAETLKRLLHDPIPTLRSVVDDVPAAIDAVCGRALARDPAHRFATAVEMADAIETAARESGCPVASEREVEGLMAERYGTAVVEQRDAVRSWLRATSSSLPGAVAEGGWMGSDQSAVAARPQPSGMAPPASARVPITRRGGSPQTLGSASGFEGAPAMNGEIDAATIERRFGDEGETTNIYDPPSQSGDVIGMVAAKPSGPVFSDPKPSLPMQRGRTPWLLAIAAILAALTAGVLVVQTTRGPSSPGATGVEGAGTERTGTERDGAESERASAREGAADGAASDPSARAADPEGEGDETARAAAEPDAAPAPADEDAAGKDAAATAAPAPRPSPKGGQAPPPPVAPPAPPTTPAPAKVPPPPKLPDEADDLSNPYR